jgi:hypothetical protein
MTNLTTLELKVIQNLKSCDMYDEKFYSTVSDISSEIKETPNVVRGVISSLVKKEVLNVETDFFRKGDKIVILN